jgi:hypothetical protein
VLRRWRKAPATAFVPWIHDYCDQWCERCALRARCLEYVVEEKARELAGVEGALPWDERDPDDPSLPADPADEELLEAVAKDLGLTPGALDWPDALEEFREELEEAEEDDEESEAALLLCEEEVYTCFCIYERLIDEFQGRLYAMIDAIEEEEGDLARVARIEKCLGGIDRYLDLLFAKLKRAYFAAFLHESHDFDSCLRDANGSAKLVLVVLEETSRAWRRVGEELSTVPREITWLLSVLEQMRDEILEHFPGAPRFKRPGFDD